MRYETGDPIWLDGSAGVVVAVVRADDDPRKCVPSGERFTWRGSMSEREDVTYLVKIRGQASLRWSYRHAVVPRLPVAECSGAGRARSVLADAQCLSTGTLSYLTGFREYAQLSDVLRLFCQHVIATEGTGVRYESWIDAWRWFVNGDVGDRMPAYARHERLFVLCVTAGSLRDDQILLRAPDGALAVAVDSPVGTLDELVATGKLSTTDGNLIRVGFVRRHWLGPKDQAMLDAWVMARALLPEAA